MNTNDIKSEYVEACFSDSVQFSFKKGNNILFGIVYGWEI